MLEIQQPGATWDEFIKRHSNAVRHTIELLNTWARVNVTSYEHIERSFPQPEGDVKPINSEVLTLIDSRMLEFGYSIHDVKLTQKLWSDFSQLYSINIRKPVIWAAAAIYTFAKSTQQM